MKDTYCECGYMVGDAGIVLRVIGISRSDGYTDLFFNNDPYGLEWFNGLKNLNVVALQDDSDIMKGVEQLVIKGLRGAEVGAVCLEEGLLIIKSKYPFVAEIQPYRQDSKPAVAITEHVDCADLDEQYPEFNDVLEAYNMA